MTAAQAATIVRRKSMPRIYSADTRRAASGTFLYHVRHSRTLRQHRSHSRTDTGRPAEPGPPRQPTARRGPALAGGAAGDARADRAAARSQAAAVRSDDPLRPAAAELPPWRAPRVRRRVDRAADEPHPAVRHHEPSRPRTVAVQG